MTIQIKDGGTGETTTPGVRKRLGLEIGTDVQPYDEDLEDIAGLTHADGNFIVSDGTDWTVESGSTARDSLGLGDASTGDIGTDVQAYDDGLDALAAFNTNGILVQTSEDTFAGRTLTGTVGNITITDGDGVSGNPIINLDFTVSTFIKDLLDDSDSSTARTTLGLGSLSTKNGPGTTVDNTLPRFDSTSGNIQTSGVLLTDSDEFQAGNGSVTTPTFSFASSSGTGMYRSDTNEISWATNGTRRWTMSANGILRSVTSDLEPSSTTTNGTELNADELVVSRAGFAALRLQRTASDGVIAQFYRNTGNHGSISITTTATAFNTTSDETLKNFIGLYDPASAISVIRADPVRDFTWKSNNSYAVGWGAQTSYSVSPDLATPGHGSPEDPDFVPWGLDQSKRTPYLWAAVSWLLDERDTLLTKLSDLESRIIALEES